MGRRKPPGDNSKVRILPELYERMRPIVAQRKKDSEFVFLHTLDNPDLLHQDRRLTRRSSFQSLALEAIEFWCDMHIPIETTPIQRLTAKGRQALEFLPTDDYHPPKRRDTWLIRFCDNLKLVLEDSESVEPLKKQLDKDEPGK